MKINGIYNISSHKAISKFDFGIALCKFLNLLVNLLDLVLFMIEMIW